MSALLMQKNSEDEWRSATELCYRSGANQINLSKRFLRQAMPLRARANRSRTQRDCRAQRRAGSLEEEAGRGVLNAKFYATAFIVIKVHTRPHATFPKVAKKLPSFGIRFLLRGGSTDSTIFVRFLSPASCVADEILVFPAEWVGENACHYKIQSTAGERRTSKSACLFSALGCHQKIPPLR